MLSCFLARAFTHAARRCGGPRLVPQRCTWQRPSAPWIRAAQPALLRAVASPADKPAGSSGADDRRGTPQGDQGGAAEPSKSDAQAGSGGGLGVFWSACTAIDRQKLMILYGTTFLHSFGYALAIPALPAISREFGFGASGIGLMVAMPSLMRVICNLGAGALADNVSRVPCMVCGEVIIAVGVLSTALGQSMTGVLPVRLFIGLGEALVYANSIAYLGAMTKQPHLEPFRGTMFGMFAAVSDLSGTVGPILGGILTDMCGSRFTHYLMTGTSVGCAMIFSHLPEKSTASIGDFRKLKPLTLLHQAAGQWKGMLGDSRQRALLLATIAVTASFCNNMCVMPQLGFDKFSMSATDVGGLFSYSAFLGLILSPVAGILFDKCGRVSSGLPALISMGVTVHLLGSLQSWQPWMAAYTLGAMGCAVAMPLMSAYAVDIAPPEHLGVALALLRQAGDITQVIAPTILGFVYDAYPGQTANNVNAALLVLAAVYWRLRAVEAMATKT